MTKVFIGGSRRVSRLDGQVRARIDRMIEQRLSVVVGDANGADKAVQHYLRDRGYQTVEVFCMAGSCRNNLGSWPTRVIVAPKGTRGFDYFTTKDREMAKEASVGFMIWDGKSFGTLVNVLRLVRQEKNSVVYNVPKKEFCTVRNGSDWGNLLAQCDEELRQRFERFEQPQEAAFAPERRVDLFSKRAG
jgi:hypothetical protein